MNMEVLTEKTNPLMKRKEVVLSISYASSTPSKADMQVAVSKQFGHEINKVDIRKIISTCGKASGKVWADLLEDREVPVIGKKEETTAEEK